jgi:CBS domain containing-hemolysin-like protein
MFGWVLFVSLVLIVINAVFVAAEFALIAAPKPSLERASSSGDRMATHVLGVIKSALRQDRYVATAQLGITLASLGLGMYGEHQLAGVFESWIGGTLSPRARATSRSCRCASTRSAAR